MNHTFPDIPDLLSRLDPGGTVPMGECPACGVLVYPCREPVRVLVLLEGGLVQDALADGTGVKVAVLDQDVEGMFDEDIVEVAGGAESLRGTLRVLEATVEVDRIRAAFMPADC